MKTSFLKPLDLLVFFPCYAGNGGYASVAATVAEWWSVVRPRIEADERIGKIHVEYIADTPITMTRNEAVARAQEKGCHLVMMVDSDMHPDFYLGHDPAAVPFWESSFDFVYGRLREGKPTVIAAPYCGPPPHENVYVFKANQAESNTHGEPLPYDSATGISIEQFTRAEAAEKSGIQAVMALPTGLILYTIDAFDCRQDRDQHKPYFYYDFETTERGRAVKKASTEDVTNTRDIFLGGWANGFGDVVFCNWGAWAGHLKNKTVGKPFPTDHAFAAAVIGSGSAYDARKKREALMAAMPEAFDFPPEDAPAKASEPPVEESANEEAPEPEAIAPACEDGVQTADGRWTEEARTALTEVLDGVASASEGEGYVVVWDDRDLAATLLASRAAVEHGRSRDDFGVAYRLADFPDEEEAQARNWNNRELATLRQTYDIAAPLSGDLAAERMDFAGTRIHAAIDLRPRVPKPLASLAVVYATFCEPTWKFAEGEGFRLVRQAGTLRIYKNVAFDSPQEARHERREPICG